jgi:hypothetical protein
MMHLMLSEIQTSRLRKAFHDGIRFPFHDEIGAGPMGLRWKKPEISNSKAGANEAMRRIAMSEIIKSGVTIASHRWASVSVWV